jgi:hypothetical protein
MLKAVVTLWHARALPVIRTKEFEETWHDFETAWLAAKRPHGIAVHVAFQAAQRAPLGPIDDNADLGVLASLCRYLAGADGRFYLACRTVEALFGVSRMTAWRWLKALQFCGVIELLTKGTLKAHRASEWRIKEDWRVP